MADLLERIGPVIGFLLALTIVAEIAQRAGVFDVAAHRAARAARGSVLRLWLLIVLLATASTIVLSLDTTAVLLTPVVLTVARQASIPPVAFALTTVWLANTASLLLPVSNLTNLLALHSFSHIPSHPSYVSTMWRPALAAIVATVVVAGLIHRRTLRGRFTTTAPAAPHDRVLLVVSAVVCCALAPLFISGIPPVYPAAAAALVLLVVLAVRDRAFLTEIKLPWLTVAAVVVLFVAVDYAGRRGLTDAIGTLTGHGGGVFELLRLSGTSALLANVGNNLPAYLAIEPVTGSLDRHAALLVGVNAGPIVTIWGSVATLLWRDRCRRAGVQVRLGTFTWQSLLIAVAAVVAATLAL
ncbi:SLC13 family permease [Yimella sp. cx-51]|uniref:SLC13 family permease n=1 Tax=Yimella sp. cx-51 TaxID=2770551 RepID=UPI00165D340E|nr:SLC13 family permease [Yimella sp. cx-51]MBC9956958.1 arsenic transporter [Yimella sp. cx-51]